MSAQLRDLGQVDVERGAARHHDDVVPSAHPRGAGFRVLSRMARKRSESAPSYAPRHRQDGEPDTLPVVG